MMQDERARGSPSPSPLRESYHMAQSPALAVVEVTSPLSASSSSPAKGDLHSRKSGKSSKHISHSSKDDDADPLEFVYPPPEVLICPIHKELLASPVIARCGHTFCRSCIEKHLSEHQQCPLDSAPLQALPDHLFPNLAVANQIANLLIYCKFGLRRRKKKGWEPIEDGCKEQIRLGDRRKHEEACGFAMIRCPYCDAPPMRRNQLEEHSKGCSRLPCPHVQAGCEFIGRKVRALPTVLVHAERT